MSPQSSKVQNPTTRRLVAVRNMFRMLNMRRREMALVVFLALAYASLEGFGLGLLMPVLQYIEAGAGAMSELHDSTLWSTLFAVADFLHVPLNLLTLLSLAFVPILVRQGVYFLNAWYSALVQSRVVVRLQERGFKALMHADLGLVLDQGQGRSVSLITYQAGRGAGAVLQFVTLLSVLALICVYVLILVFVSPGLTLIAVVALALVSIGIRRNFSRSREYGKQAAKLGNEIYAALSERVGAIRLIKMVGWEEQELRGVRRRLRELQDSQVRISVSRARLEITVDPALMLAVFAVILVGVQVLGLTLSSLGIFLVILLRLNAKAKDFNVSRQALSASLESLLMVEAFTKRAEVSAVPDEGRRPFEALSRGIEFREVVFSYDSPDGSTLVLDGVSATFESGNMTAVVGRSGAGKSTLVDLIARLKRTDSGQILLDGIPVEEFDLRSLRRGIGFMTQDAILFDASVRDNLVYGLEEEVSDESIWQALRDSYADQFVVDLPQGLDTVVGEHGARLSGGQRQRLSLARVFLKKPHIVILDEPTSALDSESEEGIQRALRGVRGSATLIVIAHRLSTVKSADQLLVLEDGKIVERGTHDSLMALGGAYVRLFESQIYSTT